MLSSKIEGTLATFGEVLKFEAGEEPKQEARRLDIQEILNYRSALQVAEQELGRRPFNLNLLLSLHGVLLDSVRGRDKAARSVQDRPKLDRPARFIDSGSHVYSSCAE